LKVSRELKTAAIAISGIALFIWGFSYIKGESLFEKPRFFYAEYDNVQGLMPSANVTINGLKVGKIEDIYFHPKRTGRLIVKFSLENEFQFSNTSVAQIYSADFISGKSIKILPSYKGAQAVSGDTLAAKVEKDILGSISKQLVPLEAKLSSSLTELETLLVSFNEVLDNQGKIDLKESLSKFKTTINSFGTTSSSINKLLAEDGDLDKTLKNASLASANLASLSDSLKNAKLGSTIIKFEKTLSNFNNILASLEKGEGTMGKLLKDEGLYKNLEGATKEMEELLREMKLNPKRFVHFSLFGKKQKPFKNGEAPKKQE
jgi:phospholipid/cholesterol/gamma-HCH transport system substrate-binding protein